jgi:hypothetical protein
MAEYFVAPQDLDVEKTYFMVSFFDRDLLVPEVTTIVYLGKDYLGEGNQMHYFQEYESFSCAQGSQSEVQLIEAAEDKLMNFFDLRGLINLLEDCALRTK